MPSFEDILFIELGFVCLQDKFVGWNDSSDDDDSDNETEKLTKSMKTFKDQVAGIVLAHGGDMPKVNFIHLYCTHFTKFPPEAGDDPLSYIQDNFGEYGIKVRNKNKITCRPVNMRSPIKGKRHPSLEPMVSPTKATLKKQAQGKN